MKEKGKRVTFKELKIKLLMVNFVLKNSLMSLLKLTPLIVELLRILKNKFVYYVKFSKNNQILDLKMKSY